MVMNWFRPTGQSTSQPLGGRYHVLQQLGAGGFGQTFLAQDLHLPGQPRCVVKQLKPQFTDPQSWQTARRLFDTEAQVLYKLGNHSQIPQLLAHFADQQEFYLVQEWVDGHPLTEELIPDRPWPPAQVGTLLEDLLGTLAFVHEQRVIHRDIKPANLMRRRDGRLVLIDFGAVKEVTNQTALAAASGHTNVTISIGTKGYMPNEQVGGNPRFSSDLYALGMVAIQALTGVHPSHLEEDPRTGEVQWRDRQPEVPTALADILDQMIRYDFRDRYPTAAEALAAIQTLPPELRQARPPSLPASDLAEATELSETASLPPRSTSQVPTLAVGGPRPTWPPAVTGQSPAAGRLWMWGGMGAAIALVVGGGLIWGIASFNDPPPSPMASPTPAAPTTEPGAIPSGSATLPSTATPPPPVSPPPAAPTQWLSEAQTFRERGQWDQALQAYDQAIAANPNSDEAQWGRCYSLNQLQRSTEAIAACDQALAINPNNPQALWSKGFALDQQGQHDAALTFYDRAIAQDGTFAAAWSNKGTALLQLGRPQEAIAAFDQALALDANLAEAWNNRGAAYWSLGNQEEAIRSIDQAIVVNPNYADALSLRAQIRQRLGR